MTSKETYVLLSRNNVYIGTYNQQEYNIILDKIEAYFYPIESLGNTCIYKTTDFNSTKLKYAIKQTLKENLYDK